MKKEVYKPVNSVLVKGFVHSDIQGISVDTKGAPFKDEVPVFSCVSTDVSNEGFDGQSNLRQISPLHKRSYEFKIGEETTVLWADEYGNVFTKITTKGNNCSNPGVFVSSVAPSGFLLYGMQESDSIVRVLKASELLRSQNIDTEVILRVIEPAEIPFGGENVSLDEFKRKIVKKVWEENALEKDVDEQTGLQKVTRGDIPKLSTALSEVTLLITIRGLQVSERIADLGQGAEDDRTRMISKAFRFINIDEKLKAIRDKGYVPQYFSADNEEDVYRYFTEYLPRRLAKNLASIHKIGLAHVFPHSANISTVGSFYDLDSVKGKSLGLGDMPITESDKFRDVTGLIASGVDFPSPDEIIDEIIGDKRNSFNRNFLLQYSEEMGSTGRNVSLFILDFLLSDDYEESELYKKTCEALNLEYSLDQRELLKLAMETLAEWRGKLEDSGLKMQPGQEEKQIIALFLNAIENFVSIEIDKKINEEFEQTVSHLVMVKTFEKIFARTEAMKMLPHIAECLGIDEGAVREEIRNPVEVFDDCRYDLYQKLTKHLGWEDDIVLHIDDIDYLFEQFASYVERPYFNYYREKLVDQLGWDLLVDDSVEEMITKFHEEDQLQAREHIDEALRTGKGQSPEDSIQQALTTANGWGVNFTRNASDRYMDFVVYYVDDKFDSQCGRNDFDLAEWYGDERASLVANWIKRKYSRELIDCGVSDEEWEEIERVARERIKQLENDYYSRLSIEPSDSANL